MSQSGDFGGPLPALSEISRTRLQSCHEDLRRVVNAAAEIVDVTVLEGHRDRDLQDMYFTQGKTKELWPNSKHNKTPSFAVDLAPFPVDWTDRKKVRFYYLAGVVKAVAESLGVSIRWGGDWNGDMDFFNQAFIDLPHFELVSGYGLDS